jgi:tRNA wybutosine-synthesizing protein 2
MSEQSLSAIVEKGRAQAAIGSLRSEGVYDADRSVYECGDETIAIPVTDAPAETDVLELVREEGPARLRTLEDHLRDRGWTTAELDRAPGSWAVLGSVVLVDIGDAPRPEEVGDALLAMHGQTDTVLAREGIAGEHREPSVRVIAGEGDTETVHREHGTTYAMDLSTVMFSPGNKAERARMGEIVSADERVLDMFAGIGYFTLPVALSGATVTAVERNPPTFQYLVENVVRNDVTDRVETYRADCRDVIASGLDQSGSFVFDRVVMGYYEAHRYLESALAALAPGGTVHMHEATPDGLVPDRPVGRLRDAVEAAGRRIDTQSTRDVKGYSEGVRHVVVDAQVE